MSASDTSSIPPELSTPIGENNSVEELHVITSIATNNANKSISIITSAKTHKYIITPKLLLCKMAHILREIVFIFLVFVVYASFSKQPTKVTKYPAAYPFFPKDSVTLDFYRGHLNNAVEYARQADLSFVMYYAPWDSESQLVRGEFELAAKGMQGKVLFTAVNCWQPLGQCRRRYSRVYTWPVLIAYPAHGKGLQYHGPKSAAHMQRFLYDVMEPLVRVSDDRDKDFLDLRSKYDSVILVKVSAQPRGRDYATVYHLSLRLLQRYTNQNVIVAVKTVKNTPEYKPEMALYSWNETLFYPSDSRWKVDDMEKWIFNSLEQIVAWVSPVGSKSTVLFSYIQGGPTMVLFTPKNPLVQAVDYYQMYRQVATKYYNCGVSNSLTEDVIYFNRIENYISYKNQLKTCLFNLEQENQTFKGSITLSGNKILANHSLCKNIVDTECSNCKEYCSLNNLNFNYMENCEKLQQKISIIAALENDTRSPPNLKKLSALNDCAKLSKALKYQPLIFAHSVTNMKQPFNRVDITGLACSNNSLTMIAMDSLKYHAFAERLGVDVLTNSKEKTAVVIIDEKQETHHVLTGLLTENKLERFIYNFTQNSLPRAKLTSAKKVEYKKCDKSKICVQELTAADFLDVVSQENKAILTLFYASHSCIFCPTISHIYLSTARLFRYAFPALQFARVNTETETLPWPYNMPTIPTILINNNNNNGNSGGAIADSNVYDINEKKVSVEGLTEFILASLKGVQKVEAWWSVCVSLRDKPGYKSSKCFTSLRLEVLSLTETVLRQWRLSSLRLKPLILRKLQNLRQLHLMLAFTPNDVTAIRNHFTLYTHR